MHGNNRVVAIEMNTMNTMQENAPTQRQQELWIDWLRYPTSSLYNITLLCKIQGRLDVARFIDCAQAVIDNEITMHQSFINHEGKLTLKQHTGPQPIEICHLEPNLSEKEEIDYLIKQAQIAIDISHWPNTITRLYHSSHTQRYYLFGIIHHILTDSRSAYILLQKAITMYKTTSYPRSTITAAANNQTVTTNNDARALTYWRNKLATGTTTLPLPDTQKRKKLPGPAAQSFFQLSEKQYMIIRKQAKQSHSTPFLTCLAIYATLLYRYSGITNFSLLYAVDNRNREEKQVPGLFANLIPMSIEITPLTTLPMLINQITKQRKSDKRYQKTSFGTITQIARETHSLTCHTPFNILYSTTMLSGRYSELQMPDCDMEVMQIRPKETNMDLALFTELHQGSRMLCLEYNCDIFDKVTIERMIDHLQTVINMIEQHNDTPLAKFPYFTHYQYHLHSTGEIQQSPPGNLLQRYQQIVSRYSNATAIDDSYGNLSYGELDTLANHYAKQFRQRGISYQTRVALLMTENTRLTIICIIALLKLRATYIPIDYHQPDKRIALIVDDAAAKFVICDSPLPKAIANKNSLEILTITNDEIIDNVAISAPTTTPDSEEDIFYIIYTSGTTGKPKGVPIGYNNVGRLIDSCQSHFNFNQDDNWTLFHSYAFDFSVWEIWGALLHGAKLCLVTEKIKQSPEKFYNYLIEKRITVLNQTPSAFYRLLTIKKSLARNLATLRYVIFGGEKLSYSTLLAQWNNKPCTTQFINMYGLTEMTVHATFHRITFDQSNNNQNNYIGYPLPGIDCLLIDQSGEPVADGMIGEICLAGKNLTRGYLNQPTLNQEKFITLQLPNQRKKIFYRSGDLAKWDENHGLIYYGRNDLQVKLHGHRVELEEIERQLQKLDGISEARVILIKKIDLTNQFLVAYVIPNRSVVFNEKYISDALAQQLPDHMQPLRIIAIDHFPLTIQGKLDNQKLQEKFTLLQNKRHTSHGQPAQTSIEIVKQCWQEVLNHQNFNTDQAFFDVGGTSMKIIQLHHKLLQYAESPFPLNSLFTHGSVNRQALLLKNSDTTTPSLQTEQDEHSEQIAIDEPIAIIGMAVQCPGAENITQFWNNLTQGIESITHFSEEALRQAGISKEELENPNYVKAKGYLEKADHFDAPFFNMSRMAATILDPQQRLFLHNAWTALEDAGYPNEECGGKIGIFASQSGISTYYQRNLLQDSTLRQQQGDYQLYIHNSIDSLASRTAYLLNLSGPAMMIQSGCSSSLVAVTQACQSLQLQECQIAIAGGVAISTPLKSGYLYQEGMILSADGHCRPFSDSADGTVPANGVGTVILKRLSDARKDGDHIYAVIKGHASNNDGMQKSGFTAPGQTGQTAVIQTALKKANCCSDDISYVEAHGTATKLGDPIEIAALSNAFRHSSDRNQYCAIGSVKSNIGHSDTAAGVIGLIKTALALKHQQLPPSLNCPQPNRNINFANSPFYINTDLRDWKPIANKPRLAGVSSFGIGGTNAHVILQQTIDSKPAPIEQPTTQIILLSAKTEQALTMQRQNLHSYLQQQPLDTKQFTDMAYTLQLGRCHFDYRQFWLAEDTTTLCAQLNIADRCPTTITNVRPVFIFPGQGNQFIETVRTAYSKDTILHKHIEQCCQLLAADEREDLYSYLYGEKRQIRLEKIPAMAQQLLLTIFSYGIAQTLMEFGVQPQAVIGHSLGEYVAACIAGVITLPTMLRLVAVRGKLSESLPAGRMLAVSAETATLQLLLENEPHASIAAFNAPTLTVIAGTVNAIARLQQQLKQQQIKCLLLNSQFAFHSADVNRIMAPFLQELTQHTFTSPTIPWLSSMTGEWIDKAINPDYFVKQLQQPVQFSTALQRSLNEAFSHFIEIGSGHALTTLVHHHQATTKPSTITPFINNHYDKNWLATTLATCWQQHIPVNWQHYQAGNSHQRMSLPTYPFQTERYWPNTSPSKLRSIEASSMFYRADWKLINIDTKAHHTVKNRIRWLALIDSTGWGNKLAIQLRQQQQQVITVIINKQFKQLSHDCYQMNPIEKHHYQQLLSLLAENNQVPDHIIHCWSLNKKEQSYGFFSLLYLIQAWSAHLNKQQCSRLTVISNHLFKISHDDEPIVEKAALKGINIVIPQEYPVQTQLMDIGSNYHTEVLIPQLLPILYQADRTPYFAWRHHLCFTTSITAADIPPTLSTPWRARGTYLITGGLGNIGLTLAYHLAKKYHAHLILISRRPASSSSTKDQLVQIKQLAASLTISHTDISNINQMTELFLSLKQQQRRIDAVFHLAAAPLDTSRCLIKDLSSDKLHKQWQAKVRGIKILQQMHRFIPIQECYLFSSISALLGGPGLSAYAAANAILDHIAIQSSTFPCYSIAWDAWHSKEFGYLQTNNQSLISKQQGMVLLDKAVTLMHLKKQKYIIISQTELTSRIKEWINPITPTTFSISKEISKTLRKSSSSSYDSDTRTIVIQTFCDCFGVKKIDPQAKFYQLGANSLIMVHLVSLLNQRLKTSISINDVMENHTINDLCRAIERKNLSTSSSKLIMLKKSDKQSPVFLLPPINGLPLPFMDLKNHLSAEHSCYTVKDPRIDNRDLSFKSIREVAQYYLDKILSEANHKNAIQWIGGYSFGATIAFEIAYLLEQQGKQPKGVFLFDGWAKFSDNFKNFDYFKKNFIHSATASLRHYGIKIDEEDYTSTISLAWNNMQLLCEYTPMTISAPIILFKPKILRSEYKPLEQKNNHWDGHSINPINTHLIDGDHSTLLYSEGAKQISKIIVQYITEINDRIGNAKIL